VIKSNLMAEKSPTRKKPAGYVSGVIIALVTLFLGSLLADRALYFFGLPSQIFLQAAHPKNYSEPRKSLEYQYLFKTNSQGLRYREIPLPKPAGAYRVFVAGDSFTEGYGVEENRRFTELLENKFSGQGREVNFINGGLSGTGPFEYSLMFYNLGLKYQPDAVLICLYANDIVTTPGVPLPRQFFKKPMLPKGGKRIFFRLWPRTYAALFRIARARKIKAEAYPSDFLRQVSEQARSNGASEAEIEAWKARLPQDLVKAVNRGELNPNILSQGLLNPSYWTDSIDLGSDTSRVQFRAMLFILSEMIAEARRRGIQVAVVYIPSPFQYDPSVFDPGNRNPYLISGVFASPSWLIEKNAAVEQLEAWAKFEGVKFLDLTPALRLKAAQSPGAFNYRIDGHLNPEGHRAVADEIERWLRQDQVFRLQ